MTCAACATRIERKLNKLDGVEATVNYATERATVSFAPAVAVGDLVAAVEAAGYRRCCPARKPGRKPPTPVGAWPSPLRSPSRSSPLDGSAAPVRRLGVGRARAGRAGRPLGRVAVPPRCGPERAPRRGDDGHADLARDAGGLGLVGRRRSSLGVDADIYFEVAAVITTLILLGRYLEARARRRSGEAIRALLELGAKEARVLRDGLEVVVPIEELCVGDRFVVGPGEKIATDGVVEEGGSAIDQSMLTGESLAGRGGTRRRGRGRHDQFVRTTRRPRDESRRRDGARADRHGSSRRRRRARPRSSVSSTGSRRIFVPIVLALSLATLVGWLLVDRRRVRRLHGRRRGAHHRVPVRARARDADRAHGRHGRGAQLGIVIKGPEMLEQTRRRRRSCSTRPAP